LTHGTIHGIIIQERRKNPTGKRKEVFLMMNFKWFDFSNIESVDELKKQYRNLVKLNHPDCGGTEENMKVIHFEYEKIFNYLSTLPNFDPKKDGTVDDCFRDIIDELSKFDNITVDIVGSWIWVHGKGTFSIKQTLMEIGFKYSGTKKMFYYVPDNQKKRIRRGYKSHTYNIIKTMWGSTNVIDNHDLELEK